MPQALYVRDGCAGWAFGLCIVFRVYVMSVQRLGRAAQSLALTSRPVRLSPRPGGQSGSLSGWVFSCCYFGPWATDVVGEEAGSEDRGVNIIFKLIGGAASNISQIGSGADDFRARGTIKNHRAL